MSGIISPSSDIVNTSKVADRDVCFLQKKGAAVRRTGLKMTANRWIKQTALKEMQNKTRSPSAVSCSGLLVRGMSPLLLHKEKNLKYMLNLIMTVSFDMVRVVYASL